MNEAGGADLIPLGLSAAAFEGALVAFPEAQLDLATPAEGLPPTKYLKKKPPHPK